MNLPAKPRKDGASKLLGYILYRGVELYDEEELQAVIDSGLLVSAAVLGRGRLIVAFDVADQNQMETLLSIIQDIIYGQIEFILASESQNRTLMQKWTVPNLLLCISLLTSTELAPEEIATRMTNANPEVAVDIVRKTRRHNEPVDEGQNFAVLAQATGNRRSDVIRQLSAASAASGASTELWLLSPSREERERYKARNRNKTGPSSTFSESGDQQTLIERIAMRRGVGLDEAVRAAAQTLDWIDREVDEGGQFVIVRNRKRRKVSFPR